MDYYQITYLGLEDMIITEEVIEGTHGMTKTIFKVSTCVRMKYFESTNNLSDSKQCFLHKF